MSTTDKLGSTTEQDFAEIKNNLKSYLKNQGEFTDYDFEGSGISSLLDVLAYNTHYMALTANMTANEMFLDSAVLRNNVVSHAKSLGYTPKSKRSAKTVINLSGITNAPPSEASQTQTITLPKGTKFSSLDSGTNFTFVTNKEYSHISYDGSVLFEDIEIFEGKYVTNTITVKSDEKQVYEIPNKNIDTTTLKVIIKDSATATTFEEYKLNKLLTDFNSDSSLYADANYFFLQEGQDERFEIYFGDDILGKKLTAGNVIEINYVITSGSAGNGIKNFTRVGSTPYIGALRITSDSPSYGGSLIESVESIKLSAPNTFMAQNRAVTSKDYEYFVREIYPELTNISVWGGEENDPPIYGKTFISVKPFTNAIKKIIVDRLKSYNVASITSEVIEPYYMYLELIVDFIYDNSITKFTENELNSLVRATVDNYNSGSLLEFNTPFRYSNFSSLIDNTDKAIISSNTSIKVKQYVEPLLQTTHLYEINFSNKIYNPYNAYKGTEGKGTVWSNGFYKDGDHNVVFYLKDSGTGKLELYYHPVGSSEMVIQDAEFGTIDYVDRYPLLTDVNTEGKIIIPSLNITGFPGRDEYLIFTAIFKSNDVVPIRNQLLQIESVKIVPTKNESL
jgi:hypothetical protein